MLFKRTVAEVSSVVDRHGEKISGDLEGVGVALVLVAMVIGAVAVAALVIALDAGRNPR